MEKLIKICSSEQTVSNWKWYKLGSLVTTHVCKPFKLHFVKDCGNVDVSHHVHSLDKLLQVLELAEGKSDLAPNR